MALLGLPQDCLLSSNHEALWAFLSHLSEKTALSSSQYFLSFFMTFMTHGRYFTRPALRLLDLTLPFSTHFPNNCWRNQQPSCWGKQVCWAFFPECYNNFPLSSCLKDRSRTPYQDMRKSLKTSTWHFSFISCWKSEGNQTVIVWYSAAELRDNTRDLHCLSSLVWNRCLQNLGYKVFSE